MKNLLYPRIRLAILPVMFAYAALGGLLGGVYGIVHDQLTYSIAPEYFTRLKFAQFQYANFGWPRRVFVAEIGFLAAWWVGFIAAWFIARLTVTAFPRAAAFRHSLRGFVIVFTCALAGAVTGYALGLAHGPDYSPWVGFALAHRIKDLPSFVRVAYIHNASYLGGLIGLILALLDVQRCKRAMRTSEPDQGAERSAASSSVSQS